MAVRASPFVVVADNRHYAEYGGYWERATSFLQEESEASGEIEFYDSNTGKLLFTGPKGRSWDEFVIESRQHGWGTHPTICVPRSSPPPTALPR